MTAATTPATYTAAPASPGLRVARVDVDPANPFVLFHGPDHLGRYPSAQAAFNQADRIFPGEPVRFVNCPDPRVTP